MLLTQEQLAYMRDTETKIVKEIVEIPCDCKIVEEISSVWESGEGKDRFFTTSYRYISIGDENEECDCTGCNC